MRTTGTNMIALVLLIGALAGCGEQGDRPAVSQAPVVSAGTSTENGSVAGTVAAVECPRPPASAQTTTSAPTTASTPTTASGTPTTDSTPTVPPPAAPVITTSTPTAAPQQVADAPVPAQEPVAFGNPNIARTATVTLQGGAFFTNGWGGGKTVDPATVVDGQFFPRNTQWDQGPVWWDSRDGVERSILIELGGVYRIDSFIVQADDNDAYVLEYRDPATGEWKTAWSVPNYDIVPSSANWGMQTRPDPADNTKRYVLPGAVITDALRFSGNMNDSDRYFSVSEIQAFGVPVPPAPSPAPVCASPYPRLDARQAGYGTPVIDGVMSADEWATAARFDLQANLPPFDGGGTTPASLFVMNDGTSLYFAVKIARASFGGATNPGFIFDNNDDGCPAEGDDGFNMYVGLYSPPTLSDIYRYSCPGAPLNSVGCSALDTETTRGILPAGSVEGRTAATNDGSFTYIEMTHPLNSGDALHDIALRPGDAVGFHFSLRLFSLTASCNYGWECMADTEVPAIGSYNAYVRVTTAPGTTP